MPYYPKNKVLTNLFSNGSPIVKLIDLSPYTGPYYKLSNGKMFIGATPNSRRYPEEIINLDEIILDDDSPVTNQISDSTTTTNTNAEIISDYLGVLEEIPSVKKIPVPFFPKPTPQDYKRGYFTRYFSKQVNDYSFIEISEKTYKNLLQKNSEYLWELYYVTEFPWQISGDVNKVFTTNKNIVEIQEKNNFKGLSKFLRENYLKFYLDKDGRKVGYVNLK